MIIKNKFRIGLLILAIFLICIASLPTVNAQEVLKSSDKPSELEQGLMYTLNSNTKNLSTEDIIKNYLNENKDKIPKIENNPTKNFSICGQNNLRSYQLKNGETITFTDGDIFYVSSIMEEVNKKETNRITASTAAGFSTTPTLTVKHDSYSMSGNIKIYSLCTKGYFEYNGKTVKAHHIDSWYSRGFCSVWKVSNWEEGGYDYTSGLRSDIYGRGDFYVEFDIGVGSLILQDDYANLYIKCDQNGKYQGLFSVIHN